LAIRRARGVLLRLVRRRRLAIVIGGLLVAAAIWLELSGNAVWWVDGLSLVLGATGAAVLWTGLTGVRPDWVDEP
jgi:hypothetical protein